jgi:phosphate transport system permease protein
MLKITSSRLLKRRTLKERFFKNICRLASLVYLAVVVLFFIIIFQSGINVFTSTNVKLDSAERLSLILPIISNNDENKQKIAEFENEGEPKWLETRGKFSSYYKKGETYNTRFNKIIDTLIENDAIKRTLSFTILINSDASEQDKAGLLGAIKGTMLIVIIFISFSSIVGISTGIYLSEFAKNKRLKNIINLNISNLASVPPIIYGIFGINFLINTLHIPRSSSLLGGIIIGLLTLPIVVIVTTDSLKSVPSHFKLSAKALGLTHMQTIFRVCLPYAFPRVLTGILLSLSRGINEATPLILIGMASFIQSPPSNFTDPATTIATQIYLWIINPDDSFAEKAFGSIFILLCIVGSINLFSSFIRYRIMKKNVMR